QEKTSAKLCVPRVSAVLLEAFCSGLIDVSDDSVCIITNHPLCASSLPPSLFVSAWIYAKGAKYALAKTESVYGLVVISACCCPDSGRRCWVGVHTPFCAGAGADRASSCVVTD
ncbi:MAG: hypothetical protein WBO46_24505, partial [Caldilineaceae bacterium]